MSNQIVSTPKEFIDAFERRFGKITWDLAANAENSKAGDRFFGPGSAHSANAFLAKWSGLGELAWLNPPFEDIEPFCDRSADAVKKYRQRNALLIPASVCTNYFIEFVKPNAYVFELTPRVFKTKIRDCVLAMFEPAGYIGRETWKWR